MQGEGGGQPGYPQYSGQVPPGNPTVAQYVQPGHIEVTHPGYPQYPGQVPPGPTQYPAAGYYAQPAVGYGQPGQTGVGYGHPAVPTVQPSYAQQQPYPPIRPEDDNYQLPADVTVDKLPMSDDDQAPMPSAPANHTMDFIQGYDTVQMDDVRLQPPSYDEVVHGDGETISRPPVHDIPVISEAEARESLVEYCTKKCCYGKGAARSMTIRSMESTSAFHYVLNTFGEARSTAWTCEPYKGEVLDTPANGPAPLPWDIPVSPPEKFKDTTVYCEVPHTASAKPCHRCVGLGRLRCRHCHGMGSTRCSCGNGYRGHGKDRRRCLFCHGTGHQRCSWCHGHGHIRCTVCQGFCNVKWYIKLTIVWTNHMEDYILERTDMPDQNVRKAQGETVFEEELPLVHAVNHCSEQSVNNGSLELVQKHRTQFATEKILAQRHSIRVVPVTEVASSWKDKEFTFFVYGLDRLVYTAEYPQTCCCGCQIL